MKSCDKTAMKNINISSILRTFIINDQISQTDLANETGLKKATVSNLVNYLLDNGLITETGEGKAGIKGGRKPRYLELDKKNILAFGASIRGTNFKAGLYNLAGKTLWNSEMEFQRAHSTLWVPAIIEKISKISAEKIKSDHVFLGAGVAIGGAYDPRDDRFLRFSLQEPVNDEKNIYIKKLLQEKLQDIPIITDDFPNAMALGELWFGCARQLSDFIYLQLENLKATVLGNKTIFRGHGMYAGQVGSWRYGTEEMRPALIKGGFSTELLTDFCTNLLLSYAPEKIILSRENLPKSASIDLNGLNERLAARFKEIDLNGFSDKIVEMGEFDQKDRALAAAALVFDNYFQSNLLMGN